MPKGSSLRTLVNITGISISNKIISARRSFASAPSGVVLLDVLEALTLAVGSFVVLLFSVQNVVPQDGVRRQRV
jgi:hypothetical protein